LSRDRFPHGNSTTHHQSPRSRRRSAGGGSEIDMVINIGKALGGDWEYVSGEIKAINDVVVAKRRDLKSHF
jgi:deoxyribose-phosphate aldolase